MKIKGNLVDVVKGAIFPAEVEIRDGKIAAIKRLETAQVNFLLPGFVDSHIHIESSMVPPSEFARIALPHGTVATVSDPHEIGNVLGLQGVDYMLENASLVPLKFNFGAPSCVPATAFETAGATLGPAEIETLLSKKEISTLSEVMNFPGVIHGDPEVLEKIRIAKKYGKRVDGHAPGVTGADLVKYIQAGIETDHECTTLAEAREKSALGMKILMREGSAARNFDALLPLLGERPEDCMFCSDDLHPDSLMKGHINLLVKRAIASGYDLMDVLRAASLNPIRHYGLDVGLLQVGDPADFLEVDNLTDFNVLATYINGVLVAQNGHVLFPRSIPKKINHFAAHKMEPKDFDVTPSEPALVIEAIDGQLITKKVLIAPRDFQREDVLKIAVVNRYSDAKPAVAFIKNFGLKEGAIASSVAHDSHNIVAVGTSSEALCQAVNCLMESKGGLAVVTDSSSSCLPLPIAGLMSDEPADTVAKRYEELELQIKKMGSKLSAPLMTLSFMALLVIPELKLSDKGLFDVTCFSFTR